MFISEVTFPHLLAERDARMADELEQQRVIEERMAEEAPTATSARPARRWYRRTVAAPRACAC